MPFMLAAAYWVVLTTPDPLFRKLLLGLPLLGVLNLVAIASIQVVPKSLLALPFWVPILTPLIAFLAHGLLLVPEDASLRARLAWAVASLTFVGRSSLFVAGYF